MYLDSEFNLLKDIWEDYTEIKLKRRQNYSHIKHIHPPVK